LQTKIDKERQENNKTSMAMPTFLDAPDVIDDPFAA
jgi:hypothetical protein